MDLSIRLEFLFEKQVHHHGRMIWEAQRRWFIGLFCSASLWMELMKSWTGSWGAVEWHLVFELKFQLSGISAFTGSLWTELMGSLRTERILAAKPQYWCWGFSHWPITPDLSTVIILFVPCHLLIYITVPSNITTLFKALPAIRNQGVGYKILVILAVIFFFWERLIMHLTSCSLSHGFILTRRQQWSCCWPGGTQEDRRSCCQPRCHLHSRWIGTSQSQVRLPGVYWLRKNSAIKTSLSVR